MDSRIVKKMDGSTLGQLAVTLSKRLGRIFSTCLDVTKEKVMIIGDTGIAGQEIALVLSYAYYLAGKDKGIDCSLVMQNQKTRGQDADENVVRALKSLPKRNVIITCLSDKFGNINSIGKSFRTYCRRQKHRFVTTSSLGYIGTEKIMDVMKAIDIDYDDIRNRQERIKAILDNAEKLMITTKKGTDIHFDIEGIESISANGIYTKPGEGGNLPAGEVYLAPKNAKGTVVVDGSSRNRFNTYCTDKKPITLQIKKGMVKKIIDGDNAQKLEESLAWAESRARYPKRVRSLAEVGIGMNKKAKIIGTTIIDEKAYGTAHVALGSNYWFGGPIRTIIHLDQVFRKPTVYADGEKIKI